MTEFLCEIGSGEQTKNQILQLAYGITLDLDDTGLLNFSLETLPKDSHQNIRAFLASNYPLVLTAAEGESKAHERATVMTKKYSRKKGQHMSEPLSKNSAYWFYGKILARVVLLSVLYLQKPLGQVGLWRTTAFRVPAMQLNASSSIAEQNSTKRLVSGRRHVFASWRRSIYAHH